MLLSDTHDINFGHNHIRTPGYNAMTSRPYDLASTYNPGYMGYQGYQGNYLGAGGYGSSMGHDYMGSSACGTPYPLSPSRVQPPPTPLSDRLLHLRFIRPYKVSKPCHWLIKGKQTMLLAHKK